MTRARVRAGEDAVDVVRRRPADAQRVGIDDVPLDGLDARRVLLVELCGAETGELGDLVLEVLRGERLLIGNVAKIQSTNSAYLPLSRAMRPATAASHAAWCTSRVIVKLHFGLSGRSLMTSLTMPGWLWAKRSKIGLY